jgi:hypothetical protein
VLRFCGRARDPILGGGVIIISSFIPVSRDTKIDIEHGRNLLIDIGAKVFKGLQVRFFLL